MDDGDIGRARLYWARGNLSTAHSAAFDDLMRAEFRRIAVTTITRLPGDRAVLAMSVEYALNKMGLLERCDRELGISAKTSGSMCDNTEYEEIMSAQDLMERK